MAHIDILPSTRPQRVGGNGGNGGNGGESKDANGGMPAVAEVEMTAMEQSKAKTKSGRRNSSYSGFAFSEPDPLTVRLSSTQQSVRKATVNVVEGKTSQMKSYAQESTAGAHPPGWRNPTP